MASGINSTFRQVGIATGIALLGSLFASRVRSAAADELARVPGLGPRAGAQVGHALTTGQLDNHRRLQVIRREIARIYTIMRERELGLSVAPDEVAS